MSAASIGLHPVSRRALAVSTALMALLALMIVVAPPALAHHPEVGGGVGTRCVNEQPVLDVTSESWSHAEEDGEGVNNSNIGVYVKTTGTSDTNYVKVGQGEYTDANGQIFSLTVSGQTVIDNGWAGQNVTVQVVAEANWGNGVAGGQTDTTTIQLLGIADCVTTTTPPTTIPVETTLPADTTLPPETTVPPVETTVAPTTTFPDQVLPTEVVPTTAAPEVSPTTLPFTGAATENLALIALVLTGTGVLALVATRRPKED